MHARPCIRPPARTLQLRKETFFWQDANWIGTFFSKVLINAGLLVLPEEKSFPALTSCVAQAQI
jgi:hypothetical protein